MLCLSVGVRALPLRMLTYADVCLRILTYDVSQCGRACSSPAYADVCRRMLAYTDVCCVSVWACVLFLCVLYLALLPCLTQSLKLAFQAREGPWRPPRYLKAILRRY